MKAPNDTRLIASEIIRELHEAGELGQLRILWRQAAASMRILVPEQYLEQVKRDLAEMLQETK